MIACASCTRRATGALALVAALLAACSDATDPRREGPVQIAGAVDLIGVGDTLRLAPRFAPGADTAASGTPIRWRSLTPSVASVDDAGLVRGLGVGTTRIVLEVGSAADTVFLRVESLPRALRFALTSDTIVRPDSVLASAPEVTDGLGNRIGSASGVRWLSSDTTVLRVDSLTGRVKAVGDGSAEVIAQQGALRGTRTVRVAWWAPLGTTQQFSDVGVGAGHSCALRTDGKALCWGAPQLSGQGENFYLPGTPVVSPAAFTSLEAGHRHTCAIGNDTQAYCWGDVTNGLVASLARTAQRLPLPEGAGAVQALMPGEEGESCVLAGDRRAWCWGLGIGQAMFGIVPGDSVAGGRVYAFRSDDRFRQVAVGLGFACALSGIVTIECWGRAGATYGVDGTSPASATPEVIFPPRAPTQVALTESGLCALDAAGEVTCWGTNRVGELGTGPMPQRLVPTRVLLPGRVTKLASNWRTGVCALVEDGGLWCWGAVHRSQDATSPPRRHGAPHRFRDFALHSARGLCGVTTDNRLLCDRRQSM